MNLQLAKTPQEIKDNFFNLKTPQDVAELLEVSYKTLIYFLYRKKVDSQYLEFTLPKKTGGVRTIRAPFTSLKILQRKLNEVFYLIYKPKPSVHGFNIDKNIVTNASLHTKKKFVVNIDIEDFFGSINFGRIRGLLKSKPYNLPPKVATVLAQICCAFNQLPQGAPTSPVLSNMVCTRLDNELQKLARKNNCTYTRYADDISFSFSNNRYNGIVRNNNGVWSAGEELEKIIIDNGFKINKKKVRISSSKKRQEVTGLTVNEFVNVQRKYVRQIRAMLHAWEKYGIDLAEKEYLTKYIKKQHNPKKPPSNFARVVEGKINFLKMVRGSDDVIYRNFVNKYNALVGNNKPEIPLTWEGEVKKSLWVLEDEVEGVQGTGFMLNGVGLVTCYHVIFDDNDQLLDNLCAFQFDKLGKKYCNFIVKKSNKIIDLAILEIVDLDTSQSFGLNIGDSTAVSVGSKLIITGFPVYVPGAEPTIMYTNCVSMKPRFNVEHFIIRDMILWGNSGGPVLNTEHRVVGVAATGLPNSKIIYNVENGVIKINYLQKLSTPPTGQQESIASSMCS